MRKQNSIIKDMKICKKILKEAYLGEEPEIGMDSQMDDEGEGQEEYQGNEDENATSVDMDDNEVVNQIRALALQGIQKYAEDVTSPLYEFFKKIWAECDKLITDAAKKQEIGGNGK